MTMQHKRIKWHAWASGTPDAGKAHIELINQDLSRNDILSLIVELTAVHGSMGKVPVEPAHE